MEPTIYKPSIYNGAGIYKTGADGGGGGGGYNGKFIYLNNFDNINGDAAISDIGDSLPIYYELFSIVNSDVFNGKNCLLMDKYPSNSHFFLLYIDFPEEYTIETYFSNKIGEYNTSSTTEFKHRGNALECMSVINSYRHECKVLDNDIILYNGAEILNDLGINKFVKIPISYNINAHYACVVKNGYSYIFVNGILYIKYKNLLNQNNIVSFGREEYPLYIGINFISVRKGDFSNNLTSFTVPANKYVFDG